MAACCPGHDVVDIGSLDIYLEDKHTSSKAQHDRLRKMWSRPLGNCGATSCRRWRRVADRNHARAAEDPPRSTLFSNRITPWPSSVLVWRKVSARVRSHSVALGMKATQVTRAQRGFGGEISPAIAAASASPRQTTVRGGGSAADRATACRRRGRRRVGPAGRGTPYRERPRTGALRRVDPRRAAPRRRRAG